MNATRRPRPSVRSTGTCGSPSVTVALLVFGAGGWALTTELAGAVLASGTVVVDGNVKAVQHPLGGVVEEIAVSNGSVVRQGDVVLRLDDDVARADLALVDSALDALFVRRARLEAERDGRAEIGPIAALAQRMGEPAVAEMIASETRYFDSRTVGQERSEGAAETSGSPSCRRKLTAFESRPRPRKTHSR